MSRWAGLVCWALVLGLGNLGALGMTEDPQEKLTKTWNLETVRSLQIRGQVQFEIVPGPRPKVTVETSRALFDQLTVSNWWGAATVAIESGLRGPRERGTVEVIIELPSLGELDVSDQSSGRVQWPPGPGASVRVGENSSVLLTFEGKMLTIEASWLSSVQMKGKTEYLTVGLRHQARVDARGLEAGSTLLQADEESTYQAGPGTRGSGQARHGSRITVPSTDGWETLVLREEAVLKTP